MGTDCLTPTLKNEEKIKSRRERKEKERRGKGRERERREKGGKRGKREKKKREEKRGNLNLSNDIEFCLKIITKLHEINIKIPKSFSF